MRSCADRALGEDYRTWIDPSRPLPGDVVLMPRELNVGQDLLFALGLGGPCAGMGTLMGMMVVRAASGGAQSLWPLLPFAVVAALLWLVPLTLLRRLVGTLRAASDARQGRLRQGLLLGPRGLLLRLAPNECFVVTAGEFVEAKLRFNPRGPTRRQGLFRIETRDDAVEFFAHRVQGEPDDVNRHAQRAWGKRKARSR